jgi:hypothetical protein
VGVDIAAAKYKTSGPERGAVIGGVVSVSV